MALTIQPTANYLLVTGNGLATLTEAQQHFRDLSAILVLERKTAKGVRLMVDLRGAAPHSPDVKAHIQRVLPVLYRQDDRVAVVVGDSAAKFYTRSSHDPLYSDVFLTREAAEAYLLA